MTQYWHFLDNLVHGNLGYSYFTGESVDTMLKQDLPPTISLVIGATILWLVFGLGRHHQRDPGPVGVRPGPSVGVLVGLSMPVFVIGELLIGWSSSRCTRTGSTSSTPATRASRRASARSSGT